MTKTEFMLNVQNFVSETNKWLAEENKDEFEVETLVDMLTDEGYEVTMDDDNVVTFKYEKHMAHIEICFSWVTESARIEAEFF